MQPLVFVTVLNWNRPGETAECIESVMKSYYKNWRIVVVDNGSTDGSTNLLRERFPETEVLEAGTNLGFAGGMNLGITFALENGADFVLILNNDAIVDPDMIEDLIKASAVEPGFCILGPTVFFYQDREKVWFKGGRRNWYWPAIDGLDCESPHSSSGPEVIPVDVVSGCGMLVKRAVFEEVGLLDTKFFMYYEDTDFCLRARQKGHNVGYVPAAKMWHKVSLSSEDNATGRIYVRAKSKAIFYKRYAKGIAAATTWPFLILSLFSTVWQDYRNGRTNASKYYLKGLIDGLFSSR